MPWSWRYERADGTEVTGASLPGTGFPTQSDAESWIGEEWRTLLAEGVEQVTLLEDDATVYGPMSLRPSGGL
ncbi:hypothetical protein [Motilibacter deserti]|uniref:YD repeat-containing protein n=1 Tax=Motilibacter deserti TaxID=2714956 RepID=A0ABX0GSX4_9ACTN|nr:hypothetical protein [Motilibacter deserti]NHC12438.1 hypothetical protein [Motilibacter deserti]